MTSPADRRRLVLVGFVGVFDRFAMPPTLLATSHDLGVPLSKVAAAAGAYFLAYGLMQPVWGIISVRIGLARTMRWCILVGSIATLAAAFAPDVMWLAIARAVAGGVFSASFPAALIYIGVTATPHERQREVTNLMSGVAIGTAGATVAAGLVTWALGWHWVYVMAGATGVVSVIFIARLEELPHVPWNDPVVAPIRRVITSPVVLVLLTLAALDGLSILGVLTFLPPAIESTGQNVATAAGITALYGAAVLGAAMIVGRMSNRVRPSLFILVGALVGSVACALLAFSIHLVAAAIACCLLGVAWASMHSSLQTWAIEVRPQERGITVSFFAGSLFAGSAIAAVLGGPLAGRGNYAVLFGVGAGVLVLAGLSGYVARSRWEQHH